MAKPLAVSTIRKQVQAKASPPPVVPGQTVYVSVLPKADLIGNVSDSSPKLFATREAAQADCDSLNKGRFASSQFVVREMEVH